MKVTYIYGPDFNHAPCVACIGFFDGLHLGHKELIERTLKAAQELTLPSVLITFDPDPNDFFGGHKNEHITDLQEKLALIEETGITETLIIHFDKTFSPSYSGR